MARDFFTPAEWCARWVAENNGLCRKCNAAAPSTDGLTCPTGCNLKPLYERGKWKPLAGVAREYGSKPSFAPGMERKIDGSGLQLTCARDVTPREIDWLWEPWLPRGKLVVLDGAPGVGKTTIMLDLIARATYGGPMPGSDMSLEPVNVLLAGVEDGWADTIKPRLDAAGADTSRIHFVSAAGDRPFTIPDDVSRLADAIRGKGAGWVHIDSIMGALGGNVRPNDDHSVRRALGPLKELGERENVLITFIRHPRKSGAAFAIDAGGGSTAFTALARLQLFAGYDPTDETPDLNARRRVLAVGKNNLGVIPQSIIYDLESAENGRPRVVWGEATDIGADEMASAPMRCLRETGRKASAYGTGLPSAISWLAATLPEGQSVAAGELRQQAYAAGHSWRTVQRAAEHLRVTPTRSSKIGEPSVWSRPLESTSSPKSQALPQVGPFQLSTEKPPNFEEHGVIAAVKHASLVTPIPVAPILSTRPDFGATDFGATKEQHPKPDEVIFGDPD